MYGLLVIWGVVTVVFFLFNVLPGDPARMMLSQREDVKQIQNLKAKYGFDKTLSKQYLLYLNDLSFISFHSRNQEDYTFLKSKKYRFKKIITSDNFHLVFKAPYLRTSFKKTDKQVSEIISKTLPNTILLACASIFIALILGLIFGTLSAIYKDSLLDRFFISFGVLGMALPSFFPR